jgi:hypothetical protein
VQEDAVRRQVVCTEAQLVTNAGPWLRLLDTYQQAFREKADGVRVQKGPMGERYELQPHSTPRQALEQGYESDPDPCRQARSPDRKGAPRAQRDDSTDESYQLSPFKQLHTSERHTCTSHRGRITKRSQPSNSGDESSSLSSSSGTDGSRSSLSGGS